MHISRTKLFQRSRSGMGTKRVFESISFHSPISSIMRPFPNFYSISELPPNFFFFFFFNHPHSMWTFPGPGIAFEPELWPVPQLWQCRILNPCAGLGIESAPPQRQAGSLTHRREGVGTSCLFFWKLCACKEQWHLGAVSLLHTVDLLVDIVSPSPLSGFFGLLPRQAALVAWRAYLLLIWK